MRKLILILFVITTTIWAQNPYQHLADSLGLFLIAPPDIDTSACQDLWFTKDGSNELNMDPISIEDGQKLYFDGLFYQANSKQLWEEALARCVIPPWAASAPCAVTCSQIIEEAAIKAGISKVELAFKNENEFGPTHNVEIAMRNLGWYYYYKTKYIAPRGAIGLWGGRFVFYGWPQHSGHIFTILEDKGPIGRDELIADNGGWGHIYAASGDAGIEGFWLPNGVFPQLRYTSKGPKLLSPTDGESGVSLSPTLTWETFNGASSYTLQVSTTKNFSNITYENNSITTTSIQISGLNQNTSYYWRVLADNDTNYSDIFRFTTVSAVLQVLWDKNAPNQPSWFSITNNTERGLAYANDKIYVVSRSSGTTVKIMSATNGNDLTVLNTTGVSGGTYLLNDVETSSDGKIFACNLTTDAKTSPFKIYLWQNDGATPTTAISYTSPKKLRFGDSFTITGSYSDKNIVIYAASPDSNLVFRWTQNSSDGSFNSTPTIITLSDMAASANLGNFTSVSPSSWDVNQYFFVVSPSYNNLRIYSVDGTLQGTITAPMLPTESTSVKTFQAGSKKYVALFLSRNTTDPNSQAGCVIDITDGILNPLQFGVTPTQRVNTNLNNTGDVAVKVNQDGTFVLFVLSTNNGIRAYNSHGSMSEINFESQISPENFTLNQNYPNPFNPSIFITYQLSRQEKVKLVVYDIVGREIAVLVDKEQDAGIYSINFDTNKFTGLSSGVYFYTLQAGNYRETKKMMLLK